MATVGISQKDQDEIFRLLSAILHLGNVKFSQEKNISSIINKEGKKKYLPKFYIYKKKLRLENKKKMLNLRKK